MMRNLDSDLTFRIEQRRNLVTELPGPKSRELSERRAEACMAALQPNLQGWIADADGGILKDVDGNSIIDFAAGMGVAGVGASNEAVAERASKQLRRYTHTCFLGSPYEPYVAVCERLNQLTPGDFEKRTALFSTGAEAIENAVKVARYYTGRNRVIVFDNAFHGRTHLTVTMTSKYVPYKKGFGILAPDVYRFAGSYPLRDGQSGPDAAKRVIDAIYRSLGADDIAAVVIEPIQGEGGFIEPAEGFLQALRDWCDKEGIVLVFDEIQSGMCRTGRWYACEHQGVVPDLITTAKAMGGGLPISALTGRATIMDAPPAGSIGGTYAGNPVACEAALASMDELERLQLADRALEMGQVIEEILGPLRHLPHVAELRGRGAMRALEFVDKEGNPDGAVTKAIATACKADGVFVLTCGQDGSVIRLLPPLVIGEELFRDGLRVLAHHIRSHAPAAS